MMDEGRYFYCGSNLRVLLWLKRSIAACVRRLLADGGIHQETGTLGTMTRDLLELAD